MKRDYKVSNIFNDSGETFSDIVSKFLMSFLDREFDKSESSGIKNTDIIANL